MSGLLVLALIGLYLWVAYKIVRRVPRWWGKALAVVVAVLLPTADAVYGRAKLKEVCEAEGGLRVKKTIPQVKGFYVDGMVPDNEWITRFGMEFVEGESRDKKLVRKERNQEGKVTILTGVQRKSEFGLGVSTDAISESFKRVEFYIYELSSGGKMATLTNITFRGGWAERVLAGTVARTPNSRGCELEKFGDVYLIKSTFTD